MYFSMDLCQIESGQRYSKRLNEEQVTNLLRATCQCPHQREQDIKNIVKQHRFNSYKVVKEFRINVREDLALVDARVLTPPTLKYHGTGGESKLALGWKMIDGGKVQFWGCLCFARMDPTLFCQVLVTMCQAKGLV
ncbi:protein argonaute MEL1-like [Trifolium pratense]|uniref:protein argonaute MEL1-like n=1 Tax=Trifolium pratense TaxID=57577 RepID=UPI001E696827|nr:protein argonaute MEL1-like [Trifolium pratense]